MNTCGLNSAMSVARENVSRFRVFHTVENLLAAVDVVCIHRGVSFWTQGK